LQKRAQGKSRVRKRTSKKSRSAKAIFCVRGGVTPSAQAEGGRNESVGKSGIGRGGFKKKLTETGYGMWQQFGKGGISIIRNEGTCNKKKGGRDRVVSRFRLDTKKGKA